MQPKPHSTNRKEVERKLIPRLFAVGCILCFFSFCSLMYALLANPYLPPSDNPSPLAEEEEFSAGTPSLITGSPFHFYAISLIFASVGALCLFTVWKKNKA